MISLILKINDFLDNSKYSSGFQKTQRRELSFLSVGFARGSWRCFEISMKSSHVDYVKWIRLRDWETYFIMTNDRYQSISHKKIYKFQLSKRAHRYDFVLTKFQNLNVSFLNYPLKRKLDQNLKYLPNHIPIYKMPPHTWGIQSSDLNDRQKTGCQPNITQLYENDLWMEMPTYQILIKKQKCFCHAYFIRRNGEQIVNVKWKK